MHRCSVCEKEFEDQAFDVVQNKCILHSEKIYPSQIDNNDSKHFFDTFADYIATQVLKFSKERDKTRIINFLTSNVAFGNLIRESVLKNKIILKDIRFPIYGSLDREYSYVNLLNKLAIIEFKNCVFEIVIQKMYFYR